MPLQRFLIAPLNEGLVTNLKPWLTPDSSFQQLNNAMAFRGRIEKRFGTGYIEGGEDDKVSRLRINIGTTSDPGGNLPLTLVPGSMANWFIGQQFSVGTALLTVYQAAGAMYSDTIGVTGNFDTGTGMVEIFGAAVATPVYYYPLMPVMGLTQFDQTNVNFEPTVAFDQQFSYLYDFSTSSFQRLGPNSLWTGDRTQFVWARMFANTNPDDDWLFAINNKPFPTGILDDPLMAPLLSSDGIKYRDDVTLATDWTNFCPLLRGNNAATALRMTGARCCIEFKGRLLFFSPYEARDTTYVAPPAPPAPITLGVSTQINNRVRYSWLQTLTDVDNCFFEASGKGGYIDAPTTQAIITVQFVKDRLIVYFENSTFELVYTGAPDQPFIWQKLDNTLGAESTFSEVPFDEVVVGIGSNGIHACNGSAVVRIDDKIPETVFAAINEFDDAVEALSSINGIRDYFKEYVYFTFPTLHTGNFPNKILTYDYKYKNWAFFDDSYTFFGYHSSVTSLIWATIPAETWAAWTNPWSYEENFRADQVIIAGNQQGFVFRINTQADLTPGLSITMLNTDNTIRCKNHNLVVGDFVKISGCTGSTNLNEVTVQVTALDAMEPLDVFSFITNPANAPIFADPGYSGGGLLQRVPNIQLTTKQFNFFTNNGQQTFIPYVEFLVDRTSDGQHTIDYQVGSSNLALLAASQGTGAILGTNILETSPYPNNQLEATQDRLWHRIYFQALNDFIQFQFYWSDAQMFDPVIPFTGFALHAMLIYANAEGSQIST